MRAFCFVGSNYIHSLGSYIADELQKKSSTYNGIIYKKYVFSEFPVKPCIGCKKCFETSNCTLDKKDHLLKIKNTMKKADIVIWITPVYAINVSGAMKHFIDRISYLLCEKCLYGKIGIVISVTESSGAELTNLYLTNIMRQAGCKKVESYKFIRAEVDIKMETQRIVDDIFKIIL